MGRGEGHAGENGTVTGKACPKGLYGVFCKVELQFLGAPCSYLLQCLVFAYMHIKDFLSVLSLNRLWLKACDILLSMLPCAYPAVLKLFCKL